MFRKTTETTQAPAPSAPEENTQLIQALEERLRQLEPTPPQTRQCEVGKGRVIPKGSGATLSEAANPFWVCGFCNDGGRLFALAQVRDYAASRILGFPLHQHRQGLGALLDPFPPPPNYKGRCWGWIKPEALAALFDKEHDSRSPGGYATITRTVEEEELVRGTGPGKKRPAQYRTVQSNISEEVFVPNPKLSEPPPRSPSRPLLPSEKQDRDIQQLEQSFAKEIARNERRRANKEARLLRLQKELENFDR
jgi:hypothetical protein